ncbi:MAG: nucleotidyl transferase AbiEii/AbiGii toxin family protein [Bacteroidales bacterium]
MIKAQYKHQVDLLLRIIPVLNEFSEFAMHGGTAINLFHHDMPRLSVDIDLTYVPFNNRETDLKSIRLLLEKISEKLRKTIPGIRINTGIPDYEEMKLFCRHNNSTVKIEVNTINRGIIDNVKQLPLCNAAQNEFNLFCEMNIVPESQLFGGKIVAALDRQHPRDLFDTKKLLDKTSITPELMKGFLFCLFSSKRPFLEILEPNYLDQKNALMNQFTGMSVEAFSYEMFDFERNRLVDLIHKSMTQKQKQMIISVAKAKPDWLYGDWSIYPGIAWKLKNLIKLKKVNSQKFKQQIHQLEVKFS